MIEWRRVVLEYPCTTCGAPPGVDCITIGGEKSYTPHSHRSRQASAKEWRDPTATDGSSVGHSPIQTPTVPSRRGHATSPE